MTWMLSAEIEKAARDSSYLSYQQSVPHEEALMLIRDTERRGFSFLG